MGVYVYAIVAQDHPVRLDGLNGVGEPPAELRTLASGPLKAVVSDAPAELRAKRRDLAAHHGVLERLMADGAVLPMRFGLVAEDEPSVASALAENADGYTGQLQRVDGCVEYNLKVSRDEDGLLREIVGESEEIRQLNERTRQNPTAHDDRIALGELVTREVERRKGDEAVALVERVAPAAVLHAETPPVEQDFLNASFLVERARAGEFTETVRAEAARRGDEYEVKLHGPLPPYSFV
ncbi:gas vesicle protein [Streptomyces armeniacus]|uniref:Gas vesicle protein n=1 Tax=Streptomyces armeniacus TaxID=83291 RepID=A0A345XQZ8_9ACTN|nr:GvpL/GvpF family gas vesicle protein [Streptomyces armeniacus]AXK34064.1 gas vesicle protein [Streptomyces armeniacus]